MVQAGRVEPAREPQGVHGGLGLYSLDDAASAGGKALDAAAAAD